jgi:hypothetical protein
MEFSASYQPMWPGTARCACGCPTVLTKTLLPMKLTIVLLTAFLFQVQAAGLAQSVTANLQKEPLRNVFKIVEKQTGVTVFYNDEYIKNAHPVTIDARQMPLADFLTAILKPEKLTFEMKQGNVVVMPKGTTGEEKNAASSGSPSLKIMVSGRVTDNNKNPLRGATIRVKGGQSVAISDEKGMFKLEAEKGEVLLITFVGFY